ncbi:MAG TPA: hypothetical protein H9841_09470 [Candidatus Flavonifractor merdigallinarum]|uniref:PQ-loop repeat-containing protein n=1 Tax=Candidatus Flavonifractor merdigallinarum TaxID=2838589 RepID=A0A9D2C038_9FIRM|nr:hypothetical protein [Candidatus Flavonifractor merdigallinarum]
MSGLEALMLLCFGAAWPFSIARSWTSRSTQGKSLFFLLVLILGYLAGIANKLLYNFDAVLFLYLINVVMVSADALLWLRNRRYEQSKSMC